MPASSRAQPRIFDLVLTLDDIPLAEPASAAHAAADSADHPDPSVWRRLRISSGATLARAQRVFCVSMGWKGGRPYSFAAGRLHYESDARGDNDLVDVRLRQLLPDSGTSLEFEYGEVHRRLTVRVERVLPPHRDIVTPRCLGGEGAATLEGPPSRLGFSVDAVNAELDRLR